MNKELWQKFDQLRSLPFSGHEGLAEFWFDVIMKATEAKLLDFLMKSPKCFMPIYHCTCSGRWGNGDVEVALSNVDELPSVIGLVRQSLELQLGNGGQS